MAEVREDAARRLWRLWQEGKGPDLAEFLSGAGPLGPLDLAGVLRIDQRQRWLLGQPISAEKYLGAYPAVAADEEAALDVIYAEFLLRRELGEAVVPEEFLQRFPHIADQLRLQFGFGAALTSTRPQPLSPEKTVPQTLPSYLGPEGPAVPGYQLLDLLGRGGMGVVYLARQLNPLRTVALKMVLAAGQPSPEELARFRAEAAAIARLNHPNIVQIYEVGEHEGRPFFSLEFVDGQTLVHKVAVTPRPAVEAAALVQTLARAMHHAHQRGLVHRDLTPANVLIRTDAVPKITDFGLARFLDGTAGLTLTHDFLGTPAYASPEQAAGKAYLAGPAADVYGLGGILYFLLTARPPFLGSSVLQTLEQVRTQDPVPPRSFRPGCPRDLETICLKCLRKEPHQRYASAEALADDLDLFQQGKPIRARPTPAWERLLKWCRRRPTAATLAGVVLAGMLLGTVSLTVAHARYRQRLDGLRRDVEAGLRAGREAAENKQWSETEAHLDNVRRATAAEPALADLHVRAEQSSIACTRFRQFLRQRDEALFQGVYVALFPGQAADLPLFPAEMEEEITACLSERQRAEIAVSRFEFLLVRADVEARVGGTADPAVRRRQARRALEILKQAALFPGETHAYHLRRAHYLGLVGAEEERQQEIGRSEALAPESALDHFLSGIHFYQQADLVRAIRSFEATLAREPDHFWGQFFLAACQLRLRNWLAAEYALNACQLQRPGFPWPLLLRGFARVELAKFSPAEDDFRQAEAALEQNPEGPASDPVLERNGRAVLYLYRGILCHRQRRLIQAAEQFTRAIGQQPALFQAHASRLRVYLEQGRLDEADRRFPELAALNPPALILADYHTNRARHLARQGKNREAVAACNAAVAARPAHAEVFALRGQALLGLEDWENAAASYDRYLDLGGRPDAEVYRGRGQARMRLGRFLDAGDDYGRALDLSAVPVGLLAAVGLPGAVALQGPEADLRVHRGWAWYFSNAFELALRDFDRARQLRPGDSDAYAGSGLCRVMLDHYPEAIADARDALRLRPGTPEMMFNVACIFSLAAGKVRADVTRPQRLDLEAEYRREAIARIRAALAMLPPEQGPPFWEKKMRADKALDPIRDSAEFARLDKDYSPPPPQKRPADPRP